MIPPPGEEAKFLIANPTMDTIEVACEPATTATPDAIPGPTLRELVIQRVTRRAKRQGRVILKRTRAKPSRFDMPSWTRPKLTVRLDEYDLDVFSAYCMMQRRSAQEVMEQWVKDTVAQAVSESGPIS